MKKILLMVVIAGTMICSCGKPKQEIDTTALDHDEEMVLEDSVVAQLDSIAGMICEIADTCDVEKIFSDEVQNLSKEQKQVKPDYLLTENDIDDLVTLQHKYVALAYLCIDQSVQQLYYGKGDDYYCTAMERLSTETDAANKKAAEAAEKKALTLENAHQFYDDMKTRHRLDKFYIAEAAYMVEALYVLSRNIELYMPAITDAQAQALSQRFNTVTTGVDIISQCHPEMQPVLDALHLIKIDAGNTEELKAQLTSSAKHIAKVRKQLLES